ncbi:MAG: ribonuclease III [Janthinobacterium lividum]
MAKKASAKGKQAVVGKRRVAVTPERPQDLCHGLEAALNYEFQQKELLELALTHSSFIYEARLGRAKTNNDEPNQPGSDNEQLEFLGDAVLGLAVTELLLRAFPERTEGELTRMRASLVSRKRMAELGGLLGLGDLLRMGRSAEATDGREKPAVLANTAEAILGALYLDVARGADSRARTGERALKVVRDVLERLVVVPDLPAIRAELEATSGRGALRDAKSRLQERVQAERAGRLIYADTGEEGPAHARRFTVEARLETENGVLRTLAAAAGSSKKEAQQTAAGVALELWDEAGKVRV